MYNIPSGWESSKIGLLFDIKQGKSLSRRKQTGTQLKKFLRTSNVLWCKLDLSNLDEMDFTDDECRKLELQYSDLLVCEGGDIGRTAIWRNELTDCYYQNHLHCLRLKDKRVNPFYAMFWLYAGMTQLGIYEGAGNKTTIPNLSRSRLSEFEICFPNIVEQKKIASVLIKIQKAIELQDKLIETINELKKATMQQLFTKGLYGEKTKQTEIGEIPESWDILTINKGYVFTKKPNNLNYKDFKEIAFVPMELIPIMSIASNKYILKEINDISSGTYFEEGDILIAKITPCFENGKQCVINDIPNGFGVATTEVIPIKEIKGISNKYYLYYYLLKPDIRSYITAKMEGATGRQRVPVNLIKNLLIPFPALPVQENISSILLSIDNKLGIYELKKTTLKVLFNSMLNKLITEDIELNALSINIEELENTRNQ